MTDDSLHDLVGLYALGALEGDEHEQFVAHLADCDECRRELDELESGLLELAWSDAESPPKSLQARVESTVSVTPQVSSLAGRRSRWQSALGTAAAVLILLVGVVALNRPSDLERVTAAPDAIELAVPATADFVGHGVLEFVYSEEEGRGVLIASGLDQAEDQVYQMWLIDGDGPVPAGTFNPDDSGAAVVSVTGVPTAGHTFGITLEPLGGSDEPTGAVLFATEL